MSKKKKNTSPTTQQKRSDTKTNSVTQNPTLLVAGAAVIILLVIAGIVLLRSGDSPSTIAADLPKEISVDEAAARRDQGAFILDVRQPEEWAEYHVPGSTLIPLDQLANRLEEVPKNQEIVVVCRSGNRSQQGRDILLDAKFSSVTSMAGGLKEWSDKGYETVSGP